MGVASNPKSTQKMGARYPATAAGKPGPVRLRSFSPLEHVLSLAQTRI
jgi:hypothetical protein